MHALKLANLMLFLSTLSLRRATIRLAWQYRLKGFLSTLSLRRATVATAKALIKIQFLSTLSLRRATFCNFRLRQWNCRFLSTLSLRRATSEKSTPEEAKRYFYPRSPCGERRQTKQICRAEISISIHALLAESDLAWHCIREDVS